MAHFYGSIKGNRGEATRCGTSGYVAMAQGWYGGIQVYLYRDPGNVDYFEVYLTSGGNGGRDSIRLASGQLDLGFIREGKTSVDLNDDLCRAYAEKRAREIMTEGVNHEGSGEQDETEYVEAGEAPLGTETALDGN